MSWVRQSVGAIVSAGNTNTTPLNVAFPASGIIAGDLLLYCAAANNAGETFTWGNTPTVLQSNNTNTGRSISATLASGSENGATVTLGGSSSGRLQGFILQYRGAPTTLTGIVNTSTTTGGGATTGLDWPTITPNVANCLVLFFAGKSNVNVTGYSAGPATTTEILDQTSGSILSSVVDEVIQTTAASITTGSWTIAGDGSGSRRCLAIALVPGTAVIQAGPLVNSELIKSLVGSSLVR